MTGSSLAPVIIPIVAAISLGVFLIIVYYADRHPEWKSASQEPEHRIAGQVESPAVGPRAGSGELTGEPPPA